MKKLFIKISFMGSLRSWEVLYSKLSILSNVKMYHLLPLQNWNHFRQICTNLDVINRMNVFHCIFHHFTHLMKKGKSALHNFGTNFMKQVALMEACGNKTYWDLSWMGYKSSSVYLNPHTFISLYIISILFSPHFLMCWQGEFVQQSRASLVGDHLLYSPYHNVWFKVDVEGKN